MNIELAVSKYFQIFNSQFQWLCLSIYLVVKLFQHGYDYLFFKLLGWC